MVTEGLAMAALLVAVAASPGCKSSAQWSAFGGSNSSSSSGGSRSSPSGGAPAAVTIGKDVELAQAKLRELGFTAKDVKIAYVVEPGCPASTVCRTSPEAWERADTTSDKIFFVGQPPESATSARPSSAPSSVPAAPKPDAAKEPPSSTKPADIF